MTPITLAELEEITFAILRSKDPTIQDGPHRGRTRLAVLLEALSITPMSCFTFRDFEACLRLKNIEFPSPIDATELGQAICRAWRVFRPLGYTPPSSGPIWDAPPMSVDEFLRHVAPARDEDRERVERRALRHVLITLRNALLVTESLPSAATPSDYREHMEDLLRGSISYVQAMVHDR